MGHRAAISNTCIPVMEREAKLRVGSLLHRLRPHVAGGEIIARVGSAKEVQYLGGKGGRGWEGGELKEEVF